MRTSRKSSRLINSRMKRGQRQAQSHLGLAKWLGGSFIFLVLCFGYFAGSSHALQQEPAPPSPMATLPAAPALPLIPAEPEALPLELPSVASLTQNKDSRLEVHFIDVGQADSILVIAKEKNAQPTEPATTTHTMLIDAGNNSDGKLVLNYLKKQNIQKIDYLVGTHPHEDHIGGLDEVIKAFPIGQIYMPKAQSNSQTFEDVLDAIASKKLTITAPKVGSVFNLGSALITILSADQSPAVKNNLNLASLVLRLDLGKTSFIFCGDAEIENEQTLLESGLPLQATVLKLGHHGSSTSSGADFLKAVSPEHAVISVGKDNSYGHPAPRTLETLKELKIPVQRTDKEGTLVFYSDGQQVHLAKR